MPDELVDRRADERRHSCTTSLGLELRAGTVHGEEGERLRRSAQGWRFIPPGSFLVHATAHFEIHYTLAAGPDQVQGGPVTAAETVSTYTCNLPGYHPSRVIGTLDPALPAPRYVQRAGCFLEEAYRVFGALGFDLPAAPVQVYISSAFPGANNGGCGYTDTDGVVVLYPRVDDVGASLEGTCYHEFFHVVQFVYYVPPPLTLHPAYWYEGSSDAAEPLVNANLTKWTLYSSFTPLELCNSYSTALLWRYLMDQLTTLHAAVEPPTTGADVLRRCWERARLSQAIDTKTLAVAVDALAPPGISFGDFRRLRTGELVSNETAWGNCLVAWRLKDLPAAAQCPEGRFVFAPAARGALSPAPVAGDALGSTISESLQPWDVRYHEIAVPAGQSVRVAVAATRAGTGDPNCLAQLVILGQNGELLDILRTTSPSYARTIGSPYGTGAGAASVGKILIVLGTRDVAADFTCTTRPVAPAPDLMITRWNSAAGREYQADWHLTPWDETTPDLQVEKRPEEARWRVRVCVRNKGNAPASNVRVHLSAGSVDGPLVRWAALRTLTLPSVAANAAVTTSTWVDVPSMGIHLKPVLGRPARLLLSAAIDAAGDTSADNNQAMLDVTRVV